MVCEGELKKHFVVAEAEGCTQNSTRVKATDGNQPDIKAIQDGCAWLGHCYDDASVLPEPEWYAMLSVVGRCRDGDDLSHEWSIPYPRYSKKETNKKLAHALTDAGPVTCLRVSQLTSNIYCAGCKWQGLITSPINLGVYADKPGLVDAVAAVEDAISSNTIEKVYEKEVIGAFRILKQKSLGKFACLKSKLKDHFKRSFNLKDFERVINQAVVQDIPESPLGLMLEELPVQDLKQPMGYRVTMSGISRIASEERVSVFPVPVVISRRLKNLDTNDEKIELSFYRDKKWNRVITERSLAMNKSSVIKLADTGLPVHSENAKELVMYLGAFDAANMDMSLTTSVSHMGWVDKKYDRFLPGVDDGIQLDLSKSTEKGYRSNGTLEQWKDRMKLLFDHPIARFIVASSFASPLLRILGQRNFLIYLYGGTRGGKTAALKTALSVWGNPEETMATFNSTRNALERKAAFYGDLPMGIDEKQVIGDQQEFVESIAYMMGNGQSRGRATQSGDLQEELTWHNITIATGEDPLSCDNSSGGVKSRTLEIYGKPIDDEGLASLLHTYVGEAYGMAGPVFIKEVIRCLQVNPEMFKSEFNRVRKELKSRFSDNIDSHISSVTVVVLGDLYMRAWLFDVPERVALEGAVELGEAILALLEKKCDTDDAKRAYDAFMSWYLVHQSYFSLESRDIYGWRSVDMLCIYPTQFRKAMKELGFNDLRMRRDWGIRGWIEIEEEGGKQRTAVRKWSEFSRKQERVVAVKLDIDV